MTSTTDRTYDVDASLLSTVEPQSVTVAFPMDDREAPLGLDRPVFLLGGGHRLAPSAMPSALGIDHVPGLRQFVAEACRRRTLSGDEGYHQPPLALLGQNGVGKGFITHWIARNAGVPLFRMPVTSDFCDPLPGAGVEMKIPLPVVAMAAARCANPVIVIELDVDHPITAEIEDVIIRMIDPRANSRWIDEDLQTIFDLHHVSWIVEVRGPRLFRSGVRQHGEPVPIETFLPNRLEAVIQDSGAVFRLGAARELEDLRILDVAIDVCAAAGVSGTDVTSEVHAALVEIDGPSYSEHVASADLVRTAKWILARHLGDEGRQ